MFTAEFKPGFRLSKIDSVFLLAALIISTIGYPYSSMISFAILFVTGHFFLFCNVFRLSRLPELIWSVSFVTLSTVTSISNAPSWVVSASICIGLAFVLIALETRKPGYHGIFWEKLNPDLPIWFSKNKGAY